MLSVDAIALGVPKLEAAQSFYESALGLSGQEREKGAVLDLYGTGQVVLHEIDALATEAGTQSSTSGFRGFAVSSIVSQPSEVVSLLEAAVKGGATVTKPAKKGFWAGFSAAYQAPDGAIWTLTAPGKKDSGPAGNPPKPTETQALLGVRSPKASKSFYVALGMAVDRDYGDKYVDFQLAPGSCRLGLMTRKALAKDVNVKEEGSGFQATVLQHRVASREEVDALLAAAVAAGGRVAVPAGETESGYAGYFADPDGFLWKAEARAL